MPQILNLSPGLEKRVRLVSDLHLGHPESLFKTVDEYKSLIDGCDELIVCGDFSETRPCAYQENALKERKLFQDLCTANHVVLHILAGNHDPDEQHAIACLYDGKVISLHGHQLFAEVAPWGREYLHNKQKAREIMQKFPDASLDLRQCLNRAKAMSAFVSPIIKKETDYSPSLLKLMKNVLSPPSRAFRIIWAWLTMRYRIKRFINLHFPDARLVCYGHLHRRDIFSEKNKTYVNLGAPFKHSNAYAVDFYKGGAHIKNICGSKAGKIIASFKLA